MIFVYTFGTAVIQAGNSRVTPKSFQKFALLLYLWAERGRWVSRAMLRDLIYCEQDEKNAMHSLRELVYQLRQRGAVVETSSYGLRLPVEKVHSDYDELLEGAPPDVRYLKTIGAAGFLPAYAPGHCEAYTEWFDAYRARATFELCTCFQKAIDQARIDSDWLVMEHAARACLAVDSLNERATLALAEILAVGGARVQATEVLDRYITDLGPNSHGLALPAVVLRRRIRDHLQDAYAVNVDFPLVGRQHEMAVLRQRLAMAKTGESQCVVLHGQPGIGKSRLAADCCAWATLGGWRVERVAVQPHDRERPMAAFVEAVPGILRLPGALGAAPESLKALTRLTKHELREVRVEFQSAESSDAVSAAIVRAIGDVIDAVTSESPLILLVEDVQWLDVESLRTLAGLVSPRRTRPLLLLLTSRERDSVRYFARHAERLASVEIGELAADNCAMLVHETIGTGWSEADRSFREWLVSASGGNPFFLYSLVRHYQTTGQQFTLSPTINALLDQRLATLTPAAMTVLWTSVALGNHSTLERLTRALEMPHMELVTTIRELEVARLIGQSGQLVTPAHWLISDAVARKANAIADKLGHRRIAGILEAEARVDNDADKLWDCAQHWLAADDRSRAIEMLTRCAQYSIEIGRVREAAELLAKAASLAVAPLRHQLACRAVQLAEQASELDVVLMAAEMVDHTSRADVHDDIEFAELFARCILAVDGDTAWTRLEACILSAHADRNHRINAGRALLAGFDTQRYPRPEGEALATLHRLLESDSEASDPIALRFLVLYHASIGDLSKCPALARRLITVAQTSRPEIAADLLRYAAGGFWRSGQTGEAALAFESAFGKANSVGLLRLEFAIAIIAASFHLDVGQEAESQRYMERAEQIADDIPRLRTGFAYTAIGVEIAATRGDIVALSRLLEIVKQENRHERHSTVYRVMRVAEISIQRISGTLLDAKAAAKELVRHHVLSGEVGNMSDMEAAVAGAVLDAAGNREAARETIVSYLNSYRRGFTPIAAILRDIVLRLEITELPAWCHSHVTSVTSR
jgi:DNA-binding SARP family transcriptional activator